MKKTTLYTEAERLKGIVDILLEDDSYRTEVAILNYVHSKIGMTETVEDEYKFLKFILGLVKVEKDEVKKLVMVKLIRESLATLFQDARITDLIHIS